MSEFTHAAPRAALVFADRRIDNYNNLFIAGVATETANAPSKASARVLNRKKPAGGELFSSTCLGEMLYNTQGNTWAKYQGQRNRRPEKKTDGKGKGHGQHSGRSSSHRINRRVSRPPLYGLYQPRYVGGEVSRSQFDHGRAAIEVLSHQTIMNGCASIPIEPRKNIQWPGLIARADGGASAGEWSWPRDTVA